MTAVMQSLIDKRDNFEIIRDKIALILTDESAQQVAYATSEGKDNPEDWALKVYTERFLPWQSFRVNDDGTIEDRTPIVNVWFERLTFDEGSSNIINRQEGPGVFNIDVYGCGVNAETEDGHKSSDEDAADNAQRASRLVRNILMSGYYVTLGYEYPQKVICGRKIRSINAFQPEQGNEAIQGLMAYRISLEVQFNEFAAEYQGEDLETIWVDIKRAEDGLVLASADISST